MTDSRFRDFGTGAPVDAAPLSFKLHGEEFNCVQQIQGKVLLDLVADSAGDDAAKNAMIIDSFFGSVLLDESFTRFNTLLKDKEKIVSVETLAQITGWLIEEYTNRPTERPEVS